MNGKILKIKGDSRFKGIQLNTEELWLIEYLYEAKVISAQNLHQFYGITSGGKRVGNTVTNRLGRLVAAGILYQLNDAAIKRVVFRPFNYAYRLGKRGLELIAERGLISQEEFELAKRYSHQIVMPNSHNNAVNTVFMELYKELRASNTTFDSMNVQNFRGDRHPLIIEVGKGNTIKPIIPDWVFETDEHIICVEVDSGTQNLGVIRSKYRRYKLLVRQSDKPIVILFSVGIFGEGENETQTKYRRIASIKDCIPESDEWPKGLDILVTPTTRTAQILAELFSRKSYRGRLHSREAANDWVLQANKVGQRGLSVHVSRNQELYQLLTKSEVDLDLVAEIKQGDHEKYAGLLFMEEGSVRSYQRARVNMTRITSWNEKRKRSETKTSLILIYENIESATNDVVAIMPTCNTLFVNHEVVENAIESGEHIFPKVLMLLTQYTRKERNLI